MTLNLNPTASKQLYRVIIIVVLLGTTIALFSIDKFSLAVGIFGASILFFLGYLNVKWILFSLVIYIPFMQVLPNIQLGTGVNLFNGILIIVILTWMLYTTRERTTMFVPNSLNKPIFWFMGISFFSLMFGFVKTGDTYYLMEKLPALWQWLSVILVYFIILSVSKSRYELTGLLFLIAGIVLLVAIDAIREHYAVVTGSSYSHDLRIGGIFLKGGENDLGALLAEFVIVPILLLFVTQIKFVKVILLGTIATILVALLFTYSRGAYLGAALGLITFVLLLGKKRLFFILLVIGIIVPSVMPESVIERVQMTTSVDENEQFESSASSRIAFWKAGMEMLKDTPMTGVGYQRYSVELPNYMSVIGQARTPHNQFVSVFSEMGLPGGIVFIWLFVSFFKLGQSLIKRENDYYSRMVGIAYMSFIIATVLINMFGVRFVRAELTGLFWVFTAIAMKIKIMNETLIIDDEAETSIKTVFSS